MTITSARLLRIYEHLTGDVVGPKDNRRKAIIAEMRAIARAKSNREGATIIEWWDWKSDQQLIAFVARARKLLARDNV